MFRVIAKEIRKIPAPIRWVVLALLIFGSAVCVQQFFPGADAPAPAEFLEIEAYPNPAGITVLVPLLLFLP